MKTTINLDAQLLAQAKKFAADSGMSLSSKTLFGNRCVDAYTFQLSADKA